MKLIIAIIQPSRLEAVKAALTEVEVFRLTVMDVQGFGRQKGHSEVYRGHEIAVNLLRKVQLQIAVNDAPIRHQRSASCGRTMKNTACTVVASVASRVVQARGLSATVWSAATESVHFSTSPPPGKVKLLQPALPAPTRQRT